jgi:hypothetical protein
LVIVSSNGLSIEDSEATRGTDVFYDIVVWNSILWFYGIYNVVFCC